MLQIFCFFCFFAAKMLKMTFSTSLWSPQHPNAGRNMQQRYVQQEEENVIVMTVDDFGWAWIEEKFQVLSLKWWRKNLKFVDTNLSTDFHAHPQLIEPFSLGWQKHQMSWLCFCLNQQLMEAGAMFAYLGFKKDFVCFNYSFFGSFKVKAFAGGFGNYCTFLKKVMYT